MTDRQRTRKTTRSRISAKADERRPRKGRPWTSQRGDAGRGPTCRICRTALARTFLDLGLSPDANAYVEPSDLARPETFYPLRVFVCDKCLLVQLEEFESPESLFSHYAYFSSYSDSWLEHARSYAERMITELRLGSETLVVEVASNDGYLLKNFTRRGIPVLGIDPAANVVEAARDRGVPTLVRFFGSALAGELAGKGRQASLLVANNVLAHVPELNDFVEGMRLVLAPGGTVTVEFPHLLRLMEKNQFDTIYLEHHSYFSFHTVEALFSAHGLRIFDVEELPTHGGSLRIYACHEEDGARSPSDRVEEVRAREREEGMDRIEGYLDFRPRVEELKRQLLSFLIDVRDEGKSVVGYGAPAKGNTLLNYCGIGTDFLQYTVDRSPHKQGRYLPGTRIPIEHPDRIIETRPDYLLILPWNLKEEIMGQMAHIRKWGGRFIVPIPEPSVTP